MESLLQGKLSDEARSEVMESVSPRSFGCWRVMRLGDVNRRSEGLDEDGAKMKQTYADNVILIW